MSEATKAAFEEYFEGRKLYGDDFTPEQIEAWYREEAEGYANLGASDKSGYHYVYHALNEYHGFSRIPQRAYRHALGIGSAYGEEFKPIARQLQRISILEPSEQLNAVDVNGVPVEYHKPAVSGEMPFDDNSFDLITCFGTLHHVPNVSYVVSEIGRVLEPGGFALIREPVVNMGDWRKPRTGLTRHERGIPHRIMEQAFDKAGLEIVLSMPCMNPVVSHLANMIPGVDAYNFKPSIILDGVLGRLMAGNISYNRDKTWKKLAPTSIYWVLTKSG